MTETGAPIRGKVARVLNSRELALNIGVKDGVTLGMRFDVIDPEGEDILDPDTGDVLGSLERPKVRVEIMQTQEKMSVARTFKTRRVNIGGRGHGSLGLSEIQLYFLPEKWITVPETLKTKEKTWEDLAEEESYVKVGDPVVQVVEEPADRAS